MVKIYFCVIGSKAALNYTLCIRSYSNVFANITYFLTVATPNQVELSEDDEFLILACDGIWYVFSRLYMFIYDTELFFFF